MVLHGDEGRQIVGNGVVLHGMELIRIAGAHPDIANIARFDDVVQSLHRLLNRCLGVEAVTLQDIDVFKIKPFQASLNAVEDVLPAEAGSVAIQ